LDNADLVFEFMLNSLRLSKGFESQLFVENTGLSLSDILPTLQLAAKKGLIQYDALKICPTELGFRFLNDLQTLFLDHKTPQIRPFFISDN
jgi:oxygen-independent coproporphyrinogen-3 oxidase